MRRVQEEELAYLFKHALTRDAAYSTLMHQDRKRLHQIVADRLESLYPDRLDDLSSLLAQHYAAAEDAHKTFQYAVQAGTAAARRSANAEACTNYDSALWAIARLPDTVDNRRGRVDTLLKRVNISLRAEGPHRSLERLAEAESLAQTLVASTAASEDQLRLAYVRYWIAQAHLHAGATGESLRYMKQVLTIAVDMPDGQELRALASSMIGRSLLVQGRFSEAQSHLRVGASLLDKFATNHEWLMAVGGLAVSCTASGNYAAGVSEAQRGLEGATQVNTLTSIALAHMWLSIVYQMGGDPVQSAAQSASILDIAKQTGDRLLLYAGYVLQAGAQSHLGDHQAAFEGLEKSQIIAQQLGGRLVFHEWFAAYAAEIALSAGLLEQAIRQSEQALIIARQAGSLYAEGLAERFWGQSLGASGSPDRTEIEQHFAASLRAFDIGDARIEAARTHVAWGKSLREGGNVDAARAHFEQAAAQFQASGLEPELAQTRDWLSVL